MEASRLLLSTKSREASISPEAAIEELPAAAAQIRVAISLHSSSAARAPLIVETKALKNLYLDSPSEKCNHFKNHGEDMIKRFAAAAAIFAAGFALCAVTYGGNVASLAKGILPKLNQFWLSGNCRKCPKMLWSYRLFCRRATFDPSPAFQRRGRSHSSSSRGSDG